MNLNIRRIAVPAMVTGTLIAVLYTPKEPDREMSTPEPIPTAMGLVTDHRGVFQLYTNGKAIYIGPNVEYGKGAEDLTLPAVFLADEWKRMEQEFNLLEQLLEQPQVRPPTL